MVQTKVFYNNRTQAVRLPMEVALPEGVTGVEIVAVGDARIITPAGRSLEWWWDNGPVLEDAGVERDQPAPQERDWA